MSRHHLLPLSLLISLFFVAACGEDADPPDRPPAGDMTMAVDMTAEEDMDAPEMDAPDMRAPDMDEPDMPDIEPNLCEPNPCTEARRSVCEARGSVVVCGCDDGFQDEGGECVPSPICDVNTCVEPNRGECTEQNGVAVCGCDDGYVERNGACVLENPCEPNPCTEANRGVCAVGANQTVTCSCDMGFRDDAGTCVPQDPCASNPCMEPNKGVCVDNAGSAVCQCDPGFQDDAGTCIDADPCDPNPCAIANKTSCSVDASNQAVCACDSGFQDDGSGGCVMIPPPSCTNQHTTGDVFEPDECVALATPIAAGQMQNHTIEPVGDVDYYRLDPMAGEILRFEETTSRDVRYVLYDTDGTTVLRSTGSEAFRWEFATAGPYYLRVSHAFSGSIGAYTLSVTSLGFDDHGDTPLLGTTAPAAPTTLMGSIETPGDRDHFIITPTAGHVLRFAEGTTTDISYVLYDTDGNTVLRSTGSEAIRWEFATAGPYYVQVRHAFSGSVGDYTIEVTDLGLDDHPDAPPMGTTAPAAPTTLMGSVETPGDRDVFIVTPPAGHVLRFAEGTSTDVSFVLYDTDGTTVLRSTGSEAWRWEFATAGPHYVQVRHAFSGSVGDYTIEVTDLGPDDHGDTIMSATMWSAGQTLPGSIETPGDRDVFEFTATAGHVYRLEETTSLDVSLTLRDTQGNILRSTSSESIQWEFATAGTYTLEVRHAFSGSVGDYSVTLTDLGLDDAGDTTATARAVTGPGMLMGSIETPGDRDVYSVTTTQANQIYYVGETTSTDVTLTLYDTDGTTILGTASSPEWFARQFTTPGTYYVAVRHAFSGSIAPYTLNFEDRGLDDHANGPTMASTILVDGMTDSGELEYRGDVDWFTFTTTLGNVYSIQVAGNSRWRATLYATDGATQLETVTNGTMFPTLAASTTYYVKVESTSTNTIGAFTLAVDD